MGVNSEEPARRPSDESLSAVQTMRQAVPPLDDVLRKTLRDLGPAAIRTGSPRAIEHESLATLTDAPGLLSFACRFAGETRDNAVRVGTRLDQPWIHRAPDWRALAAEADVRGARLTALAPLAVVLDATGDRRAVQHLVAHGVYRTEVTRRVRELRQRGEPVLKVWPNPEKMREAAKLPPLVIRRLRKGREGETSTETVADLIPDLMAAERRVGAGMTSTTELAAFGPLRSLGWPAPPGWDDAAPKLIPELWARLKRDMQAVAFGAVVEQTHKDIEDGKRARSRERRAEEHTGYYAERTADDDPAEAAIHRIPAEQAHAAMTRLYGAEWMALVDEQNGRVTGAANAARFSCSPATWTRRKHRMLAAWSRLTAE